MGKIINGMFGAIIGSMGNVTSYMLNGQNVTRLKARKISHFSENQLANQQEMKVVNEFFYFMTDFLKAGFGLAAQGTTKNYHNLATSYNKKNALKGVYPNIEMDYTKALLSTGDLLEAQNPATEAIPEGLRFSWDLPELNSRSGEDQVMILAYGTVSKKAYYILYGPKRSAGEAILQLPPKMQQEPIETYISFVSADRQSVSNSCYAGRIEPVSQISNTVQKTTNKGIILLGIVSPKMTPVQSTEPLNPISTEPHPPKNSSFRSPFLDPG